MACPCSLWRSHCQPIPQIPTRRFNRAGKSQITIFNDQNSHRGCILETRKLVFVGIISWGINADVRLFGILNFDHWNLFVIWFLELGILTIFIRFVQHLHSGCHLVKWRGPVVILSSGVKFLMQLLEVLAGDMGIDLSRWYINVTEHHLHRS